MTRKKKETAPEARENSLDFHPIIPTERDKLFTSEASSPPAFRFDDAVARVFPDMLRRSIPGYSTLLHMIGVLAHSRVLEGTHVYDLGCSLGAVSLAIRHAVGIRGAQIVAVDNSQAMVSRCREIMKADSSPCPVDVLQGDINEFSLQPCSMVVLNFTLQFAPAENRQAILSNIGKSLVPGGVLVLSEKTRNREDSTDDFFREIHDAFRESNGYSQLEISRKREALEQVLVPKTAERYEEMMTEAGLLPTEWFRCLHFSSWVATKEKK